MAQKDTRIRSLLMNPQPLTRAHIRELKERAGSWKKFSEALGYKTKTGVITAHAHPERMSKKMAARIREYELELEASKGHYFEVINLTGKTIPKHFRLVADARKCAGHQEWCFGLPKDGYCNAECREIAKSKKKKANG